MNEIDLRKNIPEAPVDNSPVDSGGFVIETYNNTPGLKDYLETHVRSYKVQDVHLYITFELTNDSAQNLLKIVQCLHNVQIKHMNASDEVVLELKFYPSYRRFEIAAEKSTYVGRLNKPLHVTIVYEIK